MGSTAARRRLRGVIFDMDGTLTVPNHDFAEMYRRVGCETKDILTEIEGWSEAERERAYAIIHEMESEALATMRRMPGAATLGAFLDARGLPRGLVTRNVQASVAHFHANAWPLPPFEPALAREFKPYKPAPDALIDLGWVLFFNRRFDEALEQFEQARAAGIDEPEYLAMTLAELGRIALEVHELDTGRVAFHRLVQRDDDRGWVEERSCVLSIRDR